MTTSLVAAYRKGAITADNLVVRCLQMIDPEAPGLVLDRLPPESIVRMGEFKAVHAMGKVGSADGAASSKKARGSGTWRSRLRPATCCFAFPIAWTDFAS
jgi:hypothetical protein